MSRHLPYKIGYKKSKGFLSNEGMAPEWTSGLYRGGSIKSSGLGAGVLQCVRS